MSQFLGKNVLFVAPKYFGYELEIKNKLEEFGAKVDYFDERPSNNSFIKASIRICRLLIWKQINRYYEMIIQENLKKKYDYIFFIHLETPFQNLLKRLRAVNPHAQYLLYMWDSMKHRPNTLKLTKYFDKVYTFDRLDSLKYNFNFLPLFFLNEYKNYEYENEKVDLTFLGTIHSDRYYIINELKKQADVYSLNCFWFLFIHNKLMFYKNKFSSIRNFWAHVNEFSFSPLDKSGVISRLKSSKVILDIQHPDNNGLTMRTLEVLALKKKLITTNGDIKNYDFYDPQNIYIIDRLKPKLNIDFFRTPYKSIDPEVLNRYSIDFWLKSIFA